MTTKEKRTLCEMFIGLSLFIMFIGFIVGMILTIIGGNNWELMKESPKLVTALWVDQSIMWFGVLQLIISAVAYNVYDNKKD